MSPAPGGTVHGRILAHADRAPDRPAVTDADRSLTYGGLRDEVRAVAAALAVRGVGPGARVALLLPNSVDFVVAALATASVGAAFVPLAVSDPPARLAAIAADADPALVVSVGDGAGAEVPGTTVAELVAEGTTTGATGTDDPVVGDADPAYAIYTSGTTGTPKGVVIPHGAFAAAVDATVSILGFAPESRALAVSPFHFDGSFGTVFPALAAGGVLVIRPREALLFPRTFVRAVQAESITHTGFSPSYLRLLLAAPGLERLAGSSLRVVALGGEAASPTDVVSLFDAVPGVRIFNRYGPTETTIAVTHAALTREVAAAGSTPIGEPHPGVTFHLVDEAGRPVVGDGTVGELLIGGRQLMSGYWGAPELTADVLRDDLVPGTTVYRTGDLVRHDPELGYLYVDRADRVVKRSGVRISLVEVGEALHGVDGVTAASAVTYDDDGRLAIAGFVVLDRDRSPLELRQELGRTLPTTMLPDRLEVVGSLPLTGAGKTDERALLAAAGLRPVTH